MRRKTQDVKRKPENLTVFDVLRLTFNDQS